MEQDVGRGGRGGTHVRPSEKSVCVPEVKKAQLRKFSSLIWKLSNFTTPLSLTFVFSYQSNITK